MRYLSGVSLCMCNLVQRLAVIVKISENKNSQRHSRKIEIFVWQHILYVVCSIEIHTFVSWNMTNRAKKLWTSGRGNAPAMQIETCRWRQTVRHTVRQTVTMTHVVGAKAYLTNCRQSDKLIALCQRKRGVCTAIEKERETMSFKRSL